MKKFSRFCLSILLPIACAFSVGFLSLRNVRIADGEGEKKGGGLIVQNGSTFTLEGNKSVSGFSADHGGGIYVYSGGTLNINGGDVFSNSATTNGGGIYVENGATFNMTDGTVSRNSAQFGGGVYNAGTFIMSGGTIASNTGDSKSTAVYSKGGFTMTGGNIIGNVQAGYNDKLLGGTIIGDVYLADNTVTIGNNVNITGNIYNNSNELYFLCQNTDDLKIQGKLYATKTIYIDDYQNNDFTSMEIVIDDASKFMNVSNPILFFNKKIKNLDLRKFNISGYDKSSYSLKICYESFNEMSVYLIEADGFEDGFLFTQSWKTEVCSSQMTSPFSRNSSTLEPIVTGISFGNKPKTGYVFIGNLSSGIAVYKNGTCVQFVADHIYAPKDCEGLFVKSDTLFSVKGANANFSFIDMSGLDTSKVTSMRALFSNAKIGEINMTGCDTSNVTDTSFMFYGTVVSGGTLNLSSLNFGKVGKFETSTHKDGECQDQGKGSAFRMFKGSSVKNLYLPTSMSKLESSHMFFDATIDNLYFSNFEYIEKFCFYWSRIGSLNGTLGNSSGGLILGFSAFSYLTNLSSIVLPSNITYLNESGEKIEDTTIGGFYVAGEFQDELYAKYNSSAFSNSEISSVEFLGQESTSNSDENAQYIPVSMFSNCANLDTVKIGEGITNIQVGAFSNTRNINNIYLPTSLKRINSYVFVLGGKPNVHISDVITWGKVSISSDSGFVLGDIYVNGKILRELEISSSTETYFPFSSMNFGGCTSIQTITVGGKLKLISSAFLNCTSLRQVNFATSSVSGGAFRGCTSLTEVNFLSEDAVTISDYAFDGLSSLMKVTFNSAVTVGQYAFRNCSSLTKLDFPSTMKYIRNSSSSSSTQNISSPFGGCLSLTEVNFLSENAITISDYAFSGLSSLMKVTFNSAVTIGQYAFQNCSSLTKLKFPASVDFGYYAFEDCTGLMYVDCPTINNIGNSAFYNCTSLQALNDGTISYSGTLGAFAFYNCESLRELNNIAQSTGIGSFAFSGCASLKKVSWKAVSGSVGSDAFKNCSSLETLNLNSENLTYDQLSGKTLSFGSTLSEDTSLKELILPPTTTSILDSAYLFKNWTNSQFEQLHVEAPYLVMFNFKSVNSLKVLYSGDSNFKLYSNSQRLSCKKVELVDGFTVIETSAFYNSSIEELILPSTVTGSLIRACYQCRSLKRVDISKTHVSFLENAFDTCSSLEEVKLPNTLLYIGEGSFAVCTSLKELSIPASVTEIGYMAFYGSNQLEVINFSSNSNLDFIGRQAFQDCSNLRDLINIEYTKVTDIGDQAFASCENLKNFAFPMKYCNIGRQAFINNKLLRIHNFTLYSTTGQTHIGDQAFMNCYSLGLDESGNNVDSDGNATEKITIKNNFQPYDFSHSNYYFTYGIGSYAFQNCISIAELDVSAVSIGPGAFSYCTKLQTLTIDVHPINTNGDFNIYTGGNSDANSLEEPKDTFYGCANLKTTYYGGNWKVIPQSCFYGCVQMTQFRPYSGKTSAITTIGEKAFKYCYSFTIQNITETERGIYLKASTKYKCSLTTNFTTGSDGKVPSTSVSKLVDSNSDDDWTLAFASTSDSSSIITVPEQTTEITTQTLEREVNQQRILPENKKTFVEEENNEGEEE